MKNRELVHAMITLAAVHRYTIGRSASAIGMYFGQPRMLEYIAERESPTQNELASALMISEPCAATSLKRMEKSGFVKREADKSDSRKKRVTVTPEGIAALNKFHEICEETDAMLFCGFSEAEKEQLFSYLNRLKSNLSADSLSPEEVHKMLHGKHGEE